MNTVKIVYLVISMTFAYVLFFVITPWVFSDLNQYRMQHISKTFSKQLSTELIKGICPYGNKATINTSIKNKNNYVSVPESMNKSGGIEFSYSFWMTMITDHTKQILFTKGLYSKNSTDPSLSDAIDGTTTEPIEHTKINTDDEDLNEQLVKCPLVKISNNALHVSFNTLRKIHNELEYKYDNIIKSSQSNPRSCLFSIVFREGEFTTDYGLKTKGIIVDLYVNEQHVKSKFIENDSLKLNEGNIHIFPEAKSEEGNTFGDLNYHNFALNVSDVEKIWKKGISKGGCTVGGNKEFKMQMNELTKSGYGVMSN
jgi:hypothetical protein